MNIARNSQSKVQMGEKVQQILQARKKQNKKGGRKHIHFSSAAVWVLEGESLSQSWYTRFFTNHKELDFGTTQDMDAGRAQNANDEICNEHFEGDAGLRAELIAAGIMDEHGVIAAPRRILNRDEKPQFVDYASQKGNMKTKTAGGRGDQRLNVTVENRECNTVDMVWGLDGFQYGPHLLVSRETITEGLVSEAMANYKSEIFEFPVMLSTFGLITNNAHGVQTGQSLLARYKVLDQELTAQDVPRPVVELSDNHESRFDPHVMAFCAEKKIRQFFEPPKTSNYLQALDQFNKKFAEAYTKEKKRYLQEKKDAYESYSHLISARFA